MTQEKQNGSVGSKSTFKNNIAFLGFLVHPANIYVQAINCRYAVMFFLGDRIAHPGLWVIEGSKWQHSH